MKKMLLLIMLLVLLVTLAACGGSEDAQTAEPVTEMEVTEPVNNDPLYFNIDKVINPDLVRRKDRVSGLYTIRFLNNGEIVELQTSRENVPSQLDNLRAVTLTFDDEGYIKKLQSAQSALGGQFFDGVVISGVNGNTFETENVGTLTVAEGADIYDLSGRSVDFGGVGQVQTGDVIAAYADENKQLQYVYILQRYVNHEENHTCDHCNTAVQWVQWDGTTALQSGHYCLDSDVTLEQALKLQNVDVVLCLNGHHITSKHRLFELGKNANLSIVDHAGAAGTFYGSMTGGGLKVKDADPQKLVGGAFYVGQGAALNIYGGNIGTTFPTDKSSYINMGGVVYCEGDFELIDGVITGADVGYSGGAVYIGKDGTFKMSGGILRYGSAYKQDKISGTGRGGTVVITKDAKFAQITGGKLLAGIVDGHGGGLYTEISMSISNAELCSDYIDGTQQAEYGGVMWVGGTESVVDLKEGTVFHSGNSIEGGNIGVRLKCTLNVHDGARIFGGYGSRNGGNIAVFGTLNIKGGTVEDGYTDGGGGNIFSYSNGDTYVNVMGGVISGGEAARGGNIAMHGTMTYEQGSILNVTGGEISGGVANKYEGGNISLRMHSVGNITGGVITGGSSAQYGGGIGTYYTKESDVSSALNIGGSAVIFDNVESDVCLAEHTVITMLLDVPLKDDAKIGLSAMNLEAVLIEKAYDKCLKAFVWTMEERSLKLEGTQIYAK